VCSAHFASTDFKACHKAVATLFEGNVIKYYPMSMGMTKRKNMQTALRSLTEETGPADLVLPQLLDYAKEMSKAQKATPASGSQGQE
jgi:hypothetical protein